jgi:hypothetical protein
MENIMAYIVGNLRVSRLYPFFGEFIHFCISDKVVQNTLLQAGRHDGTLAISQFIWIH